MLCILVNKVIGFILLTFFLCRFKWAVRRKERDQYFPRRTAQRLVQFKVFIIIWKIDSSLPRCILVSMHLRFAGRFSDHVKKKENFFLTKTIVCSRSAVLQNLDRKGNQLEFSFSSGTSSAPFSYIIITNILHFVAQLSKVKVAMTNLIPSPCHRNQDSECCKNIRDSEPYKFG